jgi:hypothetical protein
MTARVVQKSVRCADHAGKHESRPRGFARSGFAADYQRRAFGRRHATTRGHGLHHSGSVLDQAGEAERVVEAKTLVFRREDERMWGRRYNVG